MESATNDGMTALMLAARWGRTVCLNALIRTGANIRATNANEWTALMFAAQGGELACVRCLLQHNADVSHQNSEGETASVIAFSNANLDCGNTLVASELNHASTGGLWLMRKQDGQGHAAMQALANKLRLSDTPVNAAEKWKENHTCIYCCEVYKRMVIVCRNGHRMCTECMAGWSEVQNDNKTCPVCRDSMYDINDMALVRSRCRPPSVGSVLA